MAGKFSIVLILVLSTVFFSCRKEHTTVGLPIDLTRESWRACSDFKDNYRVRIPENTEGCLAVPKFPILLDRLFPLTPGSGVHDWTVETGFSLQDGKTANLALYLPVIGENWEVFLNGVSVKREIYPSDRQNLDKHRTQKGVVIDLPPANVLTGRNTLVFHIRGTASPVSFYSNDYSGFYMNQGYEVDTAENFRARHSELLSFMLYSVYFFFGIYHIVLFFSNRQEKYNLWFGLFSISLSFYSVLISSSIFDIFPEADTSILKKAEFISLFLLLPSITHFTRDYFQPGSFRWSVRIVLGWNVLLAFLALILPFTYAKVVLPIWQVSALLFQLGFLVFLIGYFAWKKLEDAYILAGAFLLTIGAAVFDITASIFVFSDVRVFQAAFFLFVISIVITIALRLRRLERSEKALNEELRDLSLAFYRFVPTQVLDQMEKTSAADLKVGDNALRLMSVLFSDIRGFTALSEKMSPDDNFRFLNSYLERMEPLIATEGGYVDKFLGDGIMALFSASTSIGSETKTTSDRALDAAIAMRQSMPEYNELRRITGYAPIDIGIGLHTGPLIIGAIGSANRIDTTVIGNTVNVASRIEGMTSYYKAGIIVSEALYLDLTEPQKYQTREIGSILVKGKTTPIVLYEIYNTDLPEIIELKNKTAPLIARGISLFRERQFEEARKQFREALRSYELDSVARLYYKLSTKFMATPVPDNWQGAIEVLRK